MTTRKNGSLYLKGKNGVRWESYCADAVLPQESYRDEFGQ